MLTRLHNSPISSDKSKTNRGVDSFGQTKMETFRFSERGLTTPDVAARFQCLLLRDHDHFAVGSRESGPSCRFSFPIQEFPAASLGSRAVLG